MTKFLNNADVTGYISQTSVTSSLLKTDANGKLVAATAGTDYQSALTNPITGTGTTNYLPKFTAASLLGDSNIQDSGSLITLGSNTYVNGSMGFGTSIVGSYIIRIVSNLTGGTATYAISNAPTIQSDVTSTSVLFRTAPSTAAASFTLASLQHFTAGTTTIGAGSTVTNQFGFLVLATAIGATNNYAFSGQLANAANTWNLYNSGTAPNYMAGSLGIGQTSLTSRSLAVSKNITGATAAYGITSDGSIQSDVTTQSAYYLTSANTVAASFTLTSLFHYLASQSTIGAGSTVANQFGFNVSANLIGATNNYAFYGNIPSGTGRWNLFMNGTADNYIAGNTGIGNSQAFVNAGPILTTTLTDGGSGYVDGTYTDVAATNISGTGVYALFTIIVSGGIVTTATLTWGGTTYRAGSTLTVSNTLLGGTGSGLVITVDTVDSSTLTVASTNGGDITLYRNDTSLSSGENIGTIKWEGRDASVKSSGIYAEIGAFSAGTAGGANLSFFTRSISAGTSLVEAMRIDSRGGVGIGATVIIGHSLRVSKNITGATTAFGIMSDGIIQSDVTSGNYFRTNASTVASSFTTNFLNHYVAVQGTFGAGSNVENQYGFHAASSLIGATNNYGFYGNIASGTGRWNLYMAGTADNYLAGNLGIGIVPTTILQVYRPSAGVVARFHSSGSDARFSANSGGFDINSTGSVLTLSTSNLERVRIDTLGAVGIGTTSLTGYNLRVSKNITGATTSYGVTSEGAIQSDVTSSARMFWTLPSIPSGSAVTDVYHYITGQGTFTGTATNQYGFVASSSLTGATNNFGFWGNVPAGTNRWNIYMAGTAANYMAGALGIGGTTINANTLLQINGSVSTATLLQMSGNSNQNQIAQINNANTGTSAQASYQLSIDAGTASLNVYSSAFGIVDIQASTFLTSGSMSGGLILGTSAATPIRFRMNGAEIARFDSNGNFGVGTNASNNASAKVQINSTTQGFLPPRMTAAQRAAITTPAEGLVVVQTDGTQGLYLYIGAAWHAMTML
jgi:hypothetical protein